MWKRPLRILVLEDSPDDAELVLAELARSGLQITSRRVSTADGLNRALDEENWDAIVSDYMMPSFDAPAALRIVRERTLDTPFIIVSGSVGEETAVQAMKAGAQDFFPKDRMTRLPEALARELREAEERRARRETAQRLRQVEETHGRVLESLSEYAIFVLDPEGAIRTWNANAQRLLGHEESAATGAPWRTLFAEEEANTADALLEEGRTGGVRDREVRVRRADGSTFWAELNLRPLQDTPDEPRVVVVFRDITERRRLLDELREALHARDTFLSIAAHELRTPLTPVLLHLDAALRAAEEEGSQSGLGLQIKQRLVAMARQIDRLKALVDNLTDVSRITREGVSVHPMEVDLSECVRTCLDALRGPLERSGSTIDVALSELPPGMWDRNRIEGIITHLLANAIKYGSGRPIQLRTEARNGRAVLMVRDGGIGLSEADQQRIFQRFERAVHERHYGGLGLGLWVVRQVVAAHNGTIRVESEPDQGTTFTVELPLLMA